MGGKLLLLDLVQNGLNIFVKAVALDALEKERKKETNNTCSFDYGARQFANGKVDGLAFATEAIKKIQGG